ncbi:MAG: ATP-binding protein [Patescibacteria group bacterium]|nr:ATP-binding protein [Patescibacteria group bacterium]
MSLSTHSNELEETTLFSLLKDSKFSCLKSGLSEKFSEILQKYYYQAVELMGKVQSIFKEYTLHDKTHILNVIDIMGKIIPNETLLKLNCLEVFLLILSACFHDIGMYLEEEDITQLKSSKEFNKSLFEFAYNKSNLAKLQEEKERNEEIGIKNEEVDKDITLLEEIHLVNFLRENHGERAVQFLINNYQHNEDFLIDKVSIIPMLSKICNSHTESINDIEVGYHELISNFEVNTMYLCIILRLADILDFDRTRSPPELLDKIQSTRSLEEWKKHLSVLGVSLSHDNVIFQCECEEPHYQYIINKFLDTIEKEIVECREKCNSFPNDFGYYKLYLPLKIDRKKIKPKDNRYIYQELFIKLNKEQMLNLFMGLQIYNHPSLCIRELAQNSIDALTLRKVIYQYFESAEPKLEIIFKHTLQEDGTETLICKDTGIGMDFNDINKYLLVSGDSYYHAYDYKRWKLKFNTKGIKCDVIAKFGIGFFSCFMIGDHINIKTRKDLGPREGIGDPFVININGSQEIITITKGDANQEVGTQIEIYKKEKEVYHHSNWDKIRLNKTLNDYFIKTDYPIKIEVTVPNLEVKKTLPPGFFNFKTELELTYDKIKTYKFDYKGIHTNLDGEIRTSFLCDDKGKITMENDEGKLEIVKNNYQIGDINSFDHRAFRTCFNGIIVYGAFGRERLKPQYGGDNIFAYPFSSATLNVTGDLQAPLSINRTGYRISDRDPKWRRIRDLAFEAYFKMWDDIIQQEKFENFENLWILIIIYHVDVCYLSNDIIMELSFPFINDEKIEWIKLREIKEIEVITTPDGWTYQIQNNLILNLTDEIKSYQLEDPKSNFLRRIITKFIKIDFDETSQKPEVSLNLKAPPTIRYSTDYDIFYFVPFNIDSILTLEWFNYDPNMSWDVFNSKHPISEIVASINYKHNDDLSEKEKFCRSFIHLFNSNFYQDYRNNEKPNPFMKYIANLYIFLIENKEDLENVIPFKIFIRDKGIIEVNGKLLKSWL